MTFKKSDFIGQTRSLLTCGSIGLLAIRDRSVVVAECTESEKDIKIATIRTVSKGGSYFTLYGARWYLKEFLPLCNFFPRSACEANNPIAEA